MSLDTNGWTSFPFSHRGYNFNAKVSPSSRSLKQILSLPEGVYVDMNKSALDTLIDFSLPLSQIAKQIDHVNENASELYLELADNGI